MRKFKLFLILNLIFFSSYGQIEKDSILIDSIIKKSLVKYISTKKLESEYAIKNLETPIYKLFSTKNTWVSLKLNTKTGTVSQIHFAIDKDSFEGEKWINLYSLLEDKEAVNGRYTLHATNNSYIFILLDQIDGDFWFIQWSNEIENRLIWKP